jgi:hypothetical protein
MSTNFKNVGDRRADRDPTADTALAARLADPARADAEDAAQRALHSALDDAQDPRRATARRLEVLAAQFGDWAVVADVLQQEDKIEGEALATAVAVEQGRYPTADAWMRANF